MAALTLQQILSPIGQPAWLSTLINYAVTIGLPTTSWRSGDPERVILTIDSYVVAQFDSLTSLITMGGFLDYAATGSVTMTFPDGTSLVVPVSPDPSTAANPSGATTFLDELCSQNYLTDRIRFTFAGGQIALTNTSGTTYPFAAGSYHVSCPANKATYANTGSLSIPPSTLVGTSVSNVTNNGGLIRVTTSAAHGLASNAYVTIIGVVGIPPLAGTKSTYKITVISSTVFDLQGSLFSGSYVSGGLVYVPTLASFLADVGGSASNSVDSAGAINPHTITTSVTALIGVSVDNPVAFVGSDTENNAALAKRAKLRLFAVTTNGAQGAVEYYALSSIQYAPKLNPPQTVVVAITRVLVRVDKTTGHAVIFLANSLGAPSTNDVNATKAVLQLWPRPVTATYDALAANEVSVTTEFDIYLPSAYATTANQGIFSNAVLAYYSKLPIGGETDPNGDYTNVVPYGGVFSVIGETAQARAIPLDDVKLQLNGSLTNNFPLTVNDTQADVAVPTITITLHGT